MRVKECENCKCNSCMNNAEDYADGGCRDCEQCEIEGYIVKHDCQHYESDDDPSGLM